MKLHVNIRPNPYTLLKIALAIVVLASGLSTTSMLRSLSENQEGFQKHLTDAARSRVDALTRNLSGALPLVTDTDWYSIYAVDVSDFCDNSSPWNPANSLTSALSERQIPTLAGDFEISDARPINKPFPGLALLLRCRNNQDILDRRPYGVWWLLKLPENERGDLRQSIVDSKIPGPIHFGPDRPLVPVVWQQVGGFTLFAAVTPKNCVIADDFKQFVDESQAENPASYAGTPEERYQAAVAYWRKNIEAKQRDWNEEERVLRAKLEAVKDKPQSEIEAVRNEVSEAAAKAKAAKDAYLQAHPQPTLPSSIL